VHVSESGTGCGFFICHFLAAHTLEITDISHSLIFRLGKETPGGAFQQFQFCLQNGCPGFRQSLNKVFQNGPQPAGDLYACSAELPDLGNGQGNEILPVWCPVKKPDRAL
jgi:hypothetical protein